MTRRTPRLLLAAGVAGAALLAGCADGGGDDLTGADETAPTIGEARVRTETTAEVSTTRPPKRTTSTTSSPSKRTTTTTTSAPTTSTTSTTTTLPATTTTAPEPARMPLTGIPLAYGQLPPDRPAAVVKVDNARGGRPQSGFNRADIVFEEIVNDNLTRFALIFHSQDGDPVGPIRSGRLQDVDLFGSYAQPFFVWSGGNATVEAAINGSDFVALNADSPDKWFNRNRSSPHQVYSNTSAVWPQTQARQGRPGQQFLYRRDGEAPIGAPSAGVGVVLDQVDVRWTWDAGSGLYRREMDGRPHDDANDGQVTTNNVVVLAMNYVEGVGSPDAQSIGYGEAFVFTGGNYVHGSWTRPDRFAPIALTADDGTPIELTPGRTFVELPRYGTTTVL
ncbi:MAG: DUF3048 domain-containing protein [Ilumatobacteraceae bacterium]